MGIKITETYEYLLGYDRHVLTRMGLKAAQLDMDQRMILGMV